MRTTDCDLPIWDTKKEKSEFLKNESRKKKENLRKVKTEKNYVYLFGFHGISTFVSYLIPNLSLYK